MSKPFALAYCLSSFEMSFFVFGSTYVELYMMYNIQSLRDVFIKIYDT